MRPSPFVEWGSRLFEQMAEEGRDFKKQRQEFDERVRLRCARQLLELSQPQVHPTMPVVAAALPEPHLLYDLGVSMQQGSRPYQEDRYALLSSERLHMVAVYDGHGGSVTSATLQQCLLPALRDALEPILERDGSMRAVCMAIHNTFMEVNTSLCTGDQNVVSDGSTAAVLIICKVQGRLLAISANAGDSRVTIGLAPQAKSSGELSLRPLPSLSSNECISGACDSGLQSVSSGQMDSEMVADGAAGWGGGSSSGEDSPTSLSPTGAGAGSRSLPPAASPLLAKRLSRDHDLKTNFEEIERIRAAGGVLMRFQQHGPLRVISPIGGLNMSRSFGDVAYHGLVIAKPFISVTPLSESVKVIIVATDGLWTVMDDDEAVACANAVMNASDSDASAKVAVASCNAEGVQAASSSGAGGCRRSAQQVADMLQHEAARRWSRRFMGHQDNTTVAVLRFCWPDKPAADLGSGGDAGVISLL